MQIIVGLGNPGVKYKKTRHNAGFMAVDALTKELGLVWEKNKKLNAEIAKQNTPLIKGLRRERSAERVRGIILVKPHAYMNNSGQAVRAILKYFKIPPLTKGAEGDLKDILTVIHDDIDIMLGKYKIAVDSGSAGHNGVQSIINFLKTKNFKRFRIGIKTEEAKHILTDKFVLGKFNNQEINIVNKVIEEVTKVIVEKL